MNRSIAHRGPDADGIWSGSQVVLGHRRLSIIDTSEAGNQPFFSEDKTLVIVFNGEIYNYRELRDELGGRDAFRTATDTEVILKAYRKWGIEAIHRFIGMFAFALWDEELKTCFVVRDRLGVKPIYLAKTESGVVFSSEIRAILRSGLIESRIDHNALWDYLRYQTVHAPRTIIRGVEMLRPGHYLRCEDDGIHEVKYWSADENVRSDAGVLTPDEVHREVKQLLESSVELRMRADVPFGAFLSGGIDSSVIVGLMSQVSSQPVQTFSVTFEEKEWDESQYSSLIARKFNTQHHPIHLSSTDFLDLVPDALNAMDHPSGDGPNTYVVSKVTREAGVKMALSGLGGDEVFAGYDVFRRMKDLEYKRWLQLTPRFARSLSGKALRMLKPSVAAEKIAAGLAEPMVDFQHLYPLTRALFTDDRIEEILSLPRTDNPVRHLVANLAHSSLDTLSRVSVAEMYSYMQNVLLRDADQMSMAHALEVRVPFLDHRLVEFVLGVQDQIKYPHTPKKLLIDSVGELLPREIWERPKMGFTFPWREWMTTSLRSFCEEHLRTLDHLEGFRPGVVMSLWKRFLQGDPLITWSRIWPLVVLGHWIQANNVKG